MKIKDLIVMLSAMDGEMELEDLTKGVAEHLRNTSLRVVDFARSLLSQIPKDHPDRTELNTCTNEGAEACRYADQIMKSTGFDSLTAVQMQNGLILVARASERLIAIAVKLGKLP